MIYEETQPEIFKNKQTGSNLLKNSSSPSWRKNCATGESRNGYGVSSIEILVPSFTEKY